MGSFRTTVVWDPMVPAVSLPAGAPRQSIRGGAGLVLTPQHPVLAAAHTG